MDNAPRPPENNSTTTEFTWEFTSVGLEMKPDLLDFSTGEYSELQAQSLIGKFHLFYHKLGRYMAAAQGAELVVLTQIYQSLAAANNHVLPFAGKDYEWLTLRELDWLEVWDVKDEQSVAKIAGQVAWLLPQIFAANDDARLVPYLEMDYVAATEMWEFSDLKGLTQMFYCRPEMAQYIIGKLVVLNDFLNTNLAYYIQKDGGIKVANYYNQLVAAHNHVRSFMTTEKPKPMAAILADDLGKIANLNIVWEYLVEFFQRVMAERWN